MVISPDGRLVYLAVRKITSPINRMRAAEEIWSYNTAEWKRTGIVSPGLAPGKQDGDQGFIGMTLGRDGKRLYLLNPETLELSIVDAERMIELRVIRSVGKPNSVQQDAGWLVSP